ncbi:hypothetical protein RRG08_047141 [Elysia crispata]|uniref:Uncharacterized protein n=1 Tax=Elysia crispata TaxID=231223 RepID=A0AAE1E383_9GAST|nr:hypothetical protein RRG08_047141 [Elysia crispata]
MEVLVTAAEDENSPLDSIEPPSLGCVNQTSTIESTWQHRVRLTAGAEVLKWTSASEPNSGACC